MASLIFLTHPEVVIDPRVPVPQWPLNDTGRMRMEHFADALSGMSLSSIHASTERKATDGAAIVAERFRLPYRVHEDLGENDRSATGYIAPPEFWDVVEAFFARPHESARGWERAIDAQARIVKAVSRIAAEGTGNTLVVSHGGVGRLLMAHAQQVEIGGESRPRHPGGGCFFVLDRERLSLRQDWLSIEEAAFPRE